MSRPRLRDRLVADARGREALYSPDPSVAPGADSAALPLTVDGQPSTAYLRRRVPGERRWEAQHQRVTFYCPRDLIRAIEFEGERSERSKSQVIVDAITEHLRARA